MLLLAADLHRCLPAATASLRAGGGTRLRMGMASGSAALLQPASGPLQAAPSVLGVRGDAADVAQEMAGACAVGAVAVDESALWRWAAAARRLPPPSALVECGRAGRRRRVGTFDLAAGAFRLPPDAAHAAAARRVCKSASFA
jgi:hypothetical protein